MRIEEKETKQKATEKLQRAKNLEKKSGRISKNFDILDDKGETVGRIDTTLLPKNKKGQRILEIGTIDSVGGQRNTFGPKHIRQVLDQVHDAFPKATHIAGTRVTGARKATGGDIVTRPLPRRREIEPVAKVISTLPDIGDKMPKFFAEMSRFAERMKVEVAKKEFIPGPSNLREVRTRSDINDLLTGGKVPTKPLDAKGVASVTKAKAEQFDAMVTEADAAGRNPVIDMTDEVTGRSSSKTLKEWQEDIRADETVTRELEKCIALQGITNA